MATTHDSYVDPRRPVDRLLGEYSEEHRNLTNQAIHWVCVPIIVWTVVAFLWLVPIPAAIGRPGFWAGLVGVGAVAFYFRLSRLLGVAMTIFFAALLALTWWLHEAIGARALLWTAVALFVASWIAQFVGHQIEGKRPTFLRDLVFLLIGPLWLMSKLLRRFGLRW